jgi:Skp family chaperone for outer membrane proteins
MKIIVILCSVLLAITASAETIKIGYIDTEQVVNNLPQYQKRVLEISKEFEPKKQELLDLFNHIELLREKIDTISKSEKKENLQIKLSELASLEGSFKEETEFWQSIALVLGWDQWGLGLNPYSSQKSSSSNKRRVYKSKTY